MKHIHGSQLSSKKVSISSSQPIILPHNPNEQFFQNLKIKSKLVEQENERSKDGFLNDCANSKGFLNLKKKYKGIRLKEKIINTQVEEINHIQKEREKEMKKFFGKS